MLADQIAKLRKKAGMSQLQLAEKLNIGASAVGMYEQGRRTPSIELVIQLANLFEVSLDYLITGRESVYAKAGEGEERPRCICPCKTRNFCDHTRQSK